jgi:hypothetical protein
VYGELAMLDEKAAKEATKNKDWPLKLRCEAACENKLNQAMDMLNLYIAEAPEKAMAQKAAKVAAKAAAAKNAAIHASFSARLEALKATQNPHDK